MTTKGNKSEKGKEVPFGRPWHNRATFQDFESADVLRHKVLKSENSEVKVKRLASGKFVVKERKKPVPLGKSKKKKKK